MCVHACGCPTDAGHHPEAMQQRACQSELQQVLSDVKLVQWYCTKVNTSMRQLCNCSSTVKLLLRLVTEERLWLIFSYQRSRRNSVRLQALSFYLQEKKVKAAPGVEVFLLVLLFLTLLFSACQCFPEKVDVDAALDLMLQVRLLHGSSLCLGLTSRLSRHH